MARRKQPRLITADGKGRERSVSQGCEDSQGSKGIVSARWPHQWSASGPTKPPICIHSLQLTPFWLVHQNKGKWPDTGCRIRVVKTQAIWKSPNLSAQRGKLPENKQEMEHSFPSVSPPPQARGMGPRLWERTKAISSQLSHGGRMSTRKAGNCYKSDFSFSQGINLPAHGMPNIHTIIHSLSSDCISIYSFMQPVFIEPL